MTENNSVPKTTAAPVSLAETRGLVHIVLWAALIGVGGWLSLPTPWGVALSLQTFFIVLCGMVEGPRLGAMAAGLYLLAGLLGLPVFTGGLGGPAILFRPSAGFALAFPLLAMVAGLGAHRRQLERKGRYSFLRAMLMGACGHLVMYVFAFAGLLINASMAPAAAALLVLSFGPGDLAKCAAAASIASARTFGRR